VKGDDIFFELFGPLFCHISNMQSKVTLYKPSQFRYFTCSSSSTPGAANEALDFGFCLICSLQTAESLYILENRPNLQL